jgi:CDGSH-type Zn-finger protein/ferredoxin
VALCRCGGSKNKPYCDGSHSEIGFDSRPSVDRTPDEVRTYEGKQVTVHYNRLLCSHAGECGRRLKSVFDSDRKPWIMSDNGTPQDIIAAVKACPSGALRYSLPGEAPQHAMPGAAGISIEKDGPYRVVGIPLATPRLAEGASRDKYTLCRCGASKNKPYCDGTHSSIRWSG